MWPLFIEKLLLAIIDANPLEQFADPRLERNARRTRLETILRALYGTPLSEGDAPINDVARLVAIARDRLLTGITRNYAENPVYEPKNETPPPAWTAGWLALLRKLPKPGPFTKSVPRSPHASETEHNSDVTRLRNVKYTHEDTREYLSWIVTFYGHDEETDMFHDLHRIAEILERWHVKAKIDVANLALGSLT